MSPPESSTPHFPSPLVNYCLIGLIFLVYAWELSLGPSLPRATGILGFVPARTADCLFHAHTAFFQALVPLFSSMFVHGNSIHLMTNVLFLFIFGDKVEAILGHGRYLILFLLGGVGANLIYCSFAPSSTIPLIGASGAIAGVMAAYFSLFPRQRFTTLFIIVWVVLQFLYGIHAAMNHLVRTSGIAWWAHVGGFLLGLVLTRFLAPTGVRLIPLWGGREKSWDD